VEAEQTTPTGAHISLEGGRLIERRDEGWVVVDHSASCLVEVKRIVWPNHEPLVFETPTGAWTPYREPREYEEGRKRRYGEALTRLGRPLLGPSRNEEETALGTRPIWVTSVDGGYTGF